MKRITSQIMRHHLSGLTRNFHTFLHENVSIPFEVGHLKVIQVTGHYVPSGDLSTSGTFGDFHRIGPVRYCGLAGLARARLRAYYKTICLHYIVEDMYKLKEVKHLHQFTMDLIDLYYAKSLSEPTR